MTPMTPQEKKALKISVVIVPVLAVIFYFTGQYLTNQIKAYNAEKYMSQPAATQEIQSKPADSNISETDKQSIRVIPVEEVTVDEKTSEHIKQASEAVTNPQNEVTVKTDDKGNQVATPDWSKEPPKTEVKTPSTTTSASSGTSSTTVKKPATSTTTKPSTSTTTPTKPKTETTKPTTTKPTTGGSTSTGGSGTKPKDGERNSKGEVYIDGFGWVKPGKGEVEVVEVNPNGNIIGH